MSSLSPHSGGNALHSAFWLLPAAMLVIATLPLPYGYYNLLRLAVCLCSIALSISQFREKGRVSGALIVFAFLAMLFNPIWPVHLDRAVWLPVDLISAAIFFLHWRSGRSASH